MMILNQRGALFGLDARISLAVFGAVAVIAGVLTANNLASTKAKTFSQELQETGQAIEAIHNDLRADVFRMLEDPSDKNAYIALYDNFQILEETRGKWLGPYITRATPVHPQYGEIRIQKLGSSPKELCTLGETCYLWLTYDAMPKTIATELNAIFDGDEQADSDLKGRLQWQQGEENNVILYFRASRALGGPSFF